ncbi:meiosis inhibitor protein 1 [Alosa pseudoharengus]|uniref:meiosis inhibitor protein 1 n=1 Tax=Alosa pseudoharengus TaxID=34774 RepID=UPI003F8B45BB
MSNMDVIYQKVHFRHDPRWSAITGPSADDVVLCVACVIEMMESKDVSCVRKSVALAGVGGVLKRSPGAIKELLSQDTRVCLHFIASLLGMLRSSEDSATLEQGIQVLVHLLLELQSKQFVQDVLNDIHTQLSQQASVRGFLPIFTFLGKLVDALPALPQTLACHHVSLLEWLSVGLQYPDEVLKASVCYILRRVWEVPAATQSLPTPLRDSMARAVLHTLHHASTPQLTINCLGLLKQMLQLGEVVSVLMNCRTELVPDEGSADWPSSQYCSLPLVLKKLLLSGDELLQVASARCMAAVLVHSPSQYCPQFIQADLPEFLFERLSSSSSEAMLWSTYGCLLLLAEESLFFSQCHTVYGIEPLVRSLKDVLKLTNLEVQKQGLQLLTVILDRQPAAVRLFPTSMGFVGVAEVVLSGVSSPCLRVATHAARAATALLRLQHQSSPVQYKELKKIVGAIITRCTELPVPITTRQSTTGVPGPKPTNQASKAGSFLLQALVCFQESCRLAEQCSSEPSLKENAFTAPNQQRKDSLEALCLSLLRSCDTVLIPTVTRLCEQAPSSQVLQHFFSILSYQFTLLPSLMPLFALKLASSGFIRLVLEHKAALCSGNRNSGLNAACCDLLLKLCKCLLSQPASSHQQDVEEQLGLLEASLLSLCSRLAEWPSLLTDASGTPRATQHCLISLLHIAQLHGDRLLPEPMLFSCMVAVLCSMPEPGDALVPLCVLRSALYLLAVCHDKSPELDWAPLNSISKALSPCPFPSLYTHHPALLHFVFRYPELSDHFGQPLLTLWLSHQPQPGREDQAEPALGVNSSSSSSSSSSSALQAVLDKNPNVTLTLMTLVVSGDERLAERALSELRCLLQARGGSDGALPTLLRPALLQLLQRLACHSTGSSQGPGPSAPSALPLILQLLCLMQTAPSAASEMDGTDFKLLFHVSNLAGKLKANNNETLLPALNYLYCCLALSPPHCSDRAVSMLLCNTGLMEQIQALLDLSSSSSFSSPPSSLLSCARLLLSSLIILQHTHSAQVHRCVRVDLGAMVQLLSCGKRHADNLSLACLVRLLQAMLDVELASPLLQLEEGAVGVRQRPLQPVDSALHPLGSHGAHALVAALHGLLLQKQEGLLSVSVNCLRSLMGFLHKRCPSTALHVASQPWGRFLLYSLLNSGESLLQHPAILALLTLLLQAGSGVVQWDPELEQVLSAVERTGVDKLRPSAAHTLKELLTQVQHSTSLTPPSEQHTLRATALLESLDRLPSPEPAQNSVLRQGELSYCSLDVTVNTGCYRE